MSWFHTLGPFLWDSCVGAPTSEVVAERCLANMPPAEAEALKGKIAIVTGCTMGGIGAVTAKILAGKAKMQVVAVGRTRSKLDRTIDDIMKEYPEAQVVPMLCDVSLLSSVRAFAAAFEERFPAANHDLALLVNNAGIMASPFSLTKEGLESQMATNHLGPFLLTTLLLSRLKKASQSFLKASVASKESSISDESPFLSSSQLKRPLRCARVVTVASCAHALPCQLEPENLNRKYGASKGGPMFAYGRSKRCNVLFAQELAARQDDVASVSVHPGNVLTNLGDHNPAIGFLLRATCCIHKNATQGAATTIYTCLATGIGEIDDTKGAYFMGLGKATKVECDEDAAARVWATSVKLTRLGMEESK